jgi:hypothetical protein
VAFGQKENRWVSRLGPPVRSGRAGSPAVEGVGPGRCCLSGLDEEDGLPRQQSETGWVVGAVLCRRAVQWPGSGSSRPAAAAGVEHWRPHLQTDAQLYR